MFGKKSKEIDALRARIDAAEPYFTLAEDIGTRVSTELAQVDPEDLDKEYDRLLGSVESEERQRQFLEVFARLPIERRHELLLAHFSDNELREALEVEKQRVIDENLHRDTIAMFSDHASRNHWIDLAEVPEGMVMSVYLYDKEEYDESESPSDLINEYEVERIVRFSREKSGLYSVIEDTTPFSDNELSPSLKIYEHVSLGSRNIGTSSATVNPRMYYGSRLYCLSDGKVKQLRTVYRQSKLELVVGRVELAGQEIMGTNIVMGQDFSDSNLNLQK